MSSVFLTAYCKHLQTHYLVLKLSIRCKLKIVIRKLPIVNYRLHTANSTSAPCPLLPAPYCPSFILLIASVLLETWSLS